MSRTEELIARSQAGDESAKELLVSENAGLIWSVEIMAKIQILQK